MLNLEKQYGIADKRRVPVDPENPSGPILHIRRIGCREYQRHQEERNMPLYRAWAESMASAGKHASALSDDAVRQLLGKDIEGVARHLWVGWENVADDETGEQVPYSYEKAKELLESTEGLYELIWAEASKHEEFRAAFLEGCKGN